MIEVIASDAWQTTFPGASVGLLELHGVANPTGHEVLAERKAALEAELRKQYGGLTRPELRALPVLQAYSRYYKRFDKTYHVQLQLESVAQKGRSIPNVAALVEAMFMAELEDQLLTAGHDVATIREPILLDAATEATQYTLANGQPGALRPGDMYMADADAVICSIVYGQDQRTRLTPETREALFVVYAPPGIEPDTVRTHLERIAEYARLVSKDARVERLEVVTAGS